MSDTVNETTEVETVDTLIPDVPAPDDNGNKFGDMFNNIKDNGKGFLDKWGGKGFIGAGAGLAASCLLFKSKSPVMTLVMIGGGFLAEKVIINKIAEIKQAEHAADNPLLNSADKNRYINDPETMDEITNIENRQQADNSGYDPDVN